MYQTGELIKFSPFVFKNGNQPKPKYCIVLTKFLKAINGCKYKNFTLLRKILEEKVKPDLLQQAIDNCTSDGDNLLLFGTSQRASKA